jgi:3-hydroxyacyl-CoA dehydrogenase/enoyl-CoA hydratase/3-hydroxybutyryl-CoA epimerase
MLDLAMVLGAGWAPHRGGPIRYARDQGTDKTIQSLIKWAQKYGPRYEPMPGLAALLASNF